ncbi:MAG: pyruvate carboxylase subunit B, partial [Candidatus Thiodiazotropha sp.]
DMGKRLEEMGCHSICIKDMAGLLNPYVGFELVTRLKEAISIPIAMQSHATTGMSTATNIKVAEAGIDMVDTSISSMSMTYGHSATESVVAILQESDRDTGLDLNLLQEIAAYFREVRKKYAKFEGSLKGVDSRILVAQVPGGMLTNMENQLREQGATDKLDQVLEEIPRVREDLGYIPLVTPTSQIVGTQAVINVLMGERYKSIAKETEGVLKGEYGATPAPVNSELQMRVLDGAEPVTCRPADLLNDEMDKLTAEFHGLADEHGIKVAADEVDDVLIYALFPQVGLKFLKNRGNPDAFEPAPGSEPAAPAAAQAAAPASATGVTGGPESYQVEVNGVTYNVKVTPSGAVSEVAQTSAPAAVPSAAPAAAASTGGDVINAPLSGNIHAIKVAVGETIAAGDVVMVLEAMKMETEVRATTAGTVAQILVKEGESVHVGSPLLSLS